MSKNIFKILSILVIGLMTSNTLVAQVKADDIIGVWELEDKTSKMEIYKESGIYYGKLLYGKDVVNADGSSKKDIENPDESLRSQNVIGSTYIKNLQFDGKEWEEGKVYDSSTGKTWSCYIELKNQTLHFTGYVGAKWLGKTYAYKRLKE